MTNWKELGEVPDSDDESLDSQVLPVAAPSSPSARQTTAEATLTDEDIWDLPASPTSRPQEKHLVTPLKKACPAIPPSSSPLSPPPADLFADENDAASRSPRSLQERTPEAQVDPFTLEDEISKSYVQVVAPSPNGALGAECLLPSEVESVGLQQALGQPGVALQEDISATRLESRSGRSFRPRKPIQQHPYLFENAQYTNFMKSRGFKPVKVAAEIETRRRREEEDGQDQEFEDEDDSQVTTGNAAQEKSGDSYPAVAEDEDRDELALTPSPPMRTSPLHRQIYASSTQSGEDQTPRTSQPEDEEFPSLEDIAREQSSNQSRGLKRHSSNKSYSAKKRPKTTRRLIIESSPPKRNHTDIYELSPSPSSTTHVSTHRSPAALREDRHETSPDMLLSSAKSSLGPKMLQQQAIERDIPVDLTVDDAGDSGETGSSSSSDSEADIVQQARRRIRGVLPASWLRLDQQKGRNKVQKKPTKTPERSPQRAPQRGVALRRSASPRATARLDFLFEDLSNDGEDCDIQPTPVTSRHEDPSHTPARTATAFDDDDSMSVVEDNAIDRMLTGKKRAGSALYSDSSKRLRRNTFKGQPSRPRQQKITGLLGRPKATTVPNGRKKQNGPPRSMAAIAQRAGVAHVRKPPPPHISILDVIQPDAPPFLKIAARSARHRPGRGKSSPSKKSIRLASRQDNLDALSVLHAWNQGKIQPRATIPSKSASKAPRTTETRKPLNPLSNNTMQKHSSQPRLSFTHPTRLTQDAAENKVGLPETKAASDPIRSFVRKHSSCKRRQLVAAARPAQLETIENLRPGGCGFVARKRALDAVYRKNRKIPAPTSGFRLERFIDDSASTLGEVDILTRTADDIATVQLPPTSPHEQLQQGKSRFRKHLKPRQIDITAPHYIHAGDPLPAAFAAAVAVQVRANDDDNDKLLGLGPFGTHYTQHFEVFPLESGVYFHESTLIGSGRLAKAMDENYYSKKLYRSRPRSVLNLEEQTFRWGQWDEMSSSEFGVLVDWIGEQLATPSAAFDGSVTLKIIRTADFILEYVQESLNFERTSSEQPFISRVAEVIKGLYSRLEPDNTAPGLSIGEREQLHTQLEVLMRILVLVFQALRISQHSSSLLAEAFELERLLESLAKLCVRKLLTVGLSEVQSTYEDLQRLYFRERGIRADRVTVQCWVLTMRVLETANIPRSSFWDVTYKAMNMSDVAGGRDAQDFEQRWQQMFTLLPLGEFDSSGVLVGGQRHILPLDGWALPQQVIKRVFQFYRANPRQSPSFNQYCRALLSRCHYLVQQWGWRKCSGIVGVIFDFFGSQNLEHLRNEEVYKSPRFLDELAGSPSLSLEPDDRCFHIFLKLLALVIKRLRAVGLIKDIRNLIARTLPNHNRQYLKEQNIHQHDLAALRNHHDLLCTLFWAAPPDLRPGLHIIEKLVMAGSSHKEACLINLRAWSQLARFVVTSGEDIQHLRPFVVWQNTVFQQLMDQYLSAAADIQQQFKDLDSKVSRNISSEMMDDMIARNRTSSKDILHFSVKATLDVMKHAPGLSAATYALNTFQLDHVFARFSFGTDLDWGILNAATDMVAYYVGLVEKAFDEQYSIQSDDVDTSSHTEEAILLLDHKIAKGFFSMARSVLAVDVQPSSQANKNKQAACTEELVVVSARLASRFIHACLGGVSLKSFFCRGKYGLFDTMPKDLGLLPRKYLPLFAATLIKQNLFDFKDIDNTILEIWLLSIIKPYRYMAYEYQLGGILQQHNIPAVANVLITPEIRPDYPSNQEFFACGISSMRREIRKADPGRAKQLREEYARLLRRAMEQLKNDLKVTKTDESDHSRYVHFVRSIITLIKSHGGDICRVDPFFYQISPEYSPSLEDPQLHAAGIVAYGIRLGEGDSMAVPQLFHYLYQNFKLALLNDKLGDECRIIERGMDNRCILSFMLTRLLPAVIRASLNASEAWPLLDMYGKALCHVLTRSAVPRELKEEDRESIVALLDTTLGWMRRVKAESTTTLSAQHVHVLTQLVTLVTVLEPTLRCFSCEPHETNASLERASTALGEYCHAMARNLDKLHANMAGLSSVACTATDLFCGVHDPDNNTRFAADSQVDGFARHIVTDIGRSWVVTSDTVLIKASTQSGKGTRYGPWDLTDLLGRLFDAVRHCRLAPPSGRKGRRRRVDIDVVMPVGEELVF